MITQTINLNLIPDSMPIYVDADQYDEGPSRLIMNLYAGDEPYIPSDGARALIQGTKPDGRVFCNSASIDGNTVTATISSQMSAVSGSVRCQVVVMETNGRIGSFVFILRVQHSALPPDEALSRSEYGIVEDLIRLVEAVRVCPPIIGENGHWWLFDVDTESYEDSGIDAELSFSIADITMIAEGADPYITNTGTDTDPVYHLFIPSARTGNGISGIAKTGTSGLVDTYRITYTNGDHFDFTVTNGAKGDTGTTPVITATASVDASSGAPAVEITKTGTAEAPAFNFAFTGLKGEPYEWNTYVVTLYAGSTEITIHDDEITYSSCIDVYTDNYSVAPDDMVAAQGVLTLTFSPQAEDLVVVVRIS